jgi:hypothetical protein
MAIRLNGISRYAGEGRISAFDSATATSAPALLLGMDCRNAQDGADSAPVLKRGFGARI